MTPHSVTFVGSDALVLRQSPEMSFYLVLEAEFPLLLTLTDRPLFYS